MVPPRVLRAMAHPLMGHLDPQFLNVMKEVQDLLRYVFQTNNQLTLPISGTGSASMESTLANFIEPGDVILIGVNGYFGERMCDMAGRYGAVVNRLDKPWGESFDPQEIEAALQKRPAKMVALVHAETSTGGLTPVEGMAEVAHKHGALLLIDCVTSLGGIPLKIDEWDIDLAYSCSQKCLGCPPGLGPLTVGRRALDWLHKRQTRIPNFYLDLAMLERYWGEEHIYHHTAPISMNFALREALRLVQEEGLENSYKRHQENASLLWDGLEELGLKMLVPLQRRLPMLTVVMVPEDVNEIEVRRRLLEEYNIEIGGGLGTLKGKVWRIGLMGYSSRRENIVLLLAALKKILAK